MGVHIANEAFDDTNGSSGLAYEIADLFTNAASDEKIWHGSKRKTVSCDPNTVCDFAVLE